MLIDMHVHCGRQFFPMRSLDGKDIIDVMDRHGIDIAIISNCDGIYYDFHGCNEQLEEILAYAPQRLYGYVVVNPNYPLESMELLRRYAEHPGFLGAKFHASWHAQPIDGKAFEPLFALCEKLSMPVLIHSYVVDDYADQVSSPDRIMNVAKRHFSPLIIAHLGGNHLRTVRAMLEGGNPPHVYTDISTGRERASQLYAWKQGKLEEVVKAIGAEKVLFGTDFAPLDPSISMGMLVDSALTEKERELIMFRNAARLFHLPIAHP